MSTTKEKETASKDLPCPGSKIRSKGKGRGLGRGKGKGPIGIPIGGKKEACDKLAAYLRYLSKKACNKSKKKKLKQAVWINGKHYRHSPKKAAEGAPTILVKVAQDAVTRLLAMPGPEQEKQMLALKEANNVLHTAVLGQLYDLQQASQRTNLEKVADALETNQDIFSAVSEVYRDKSAAYHYKVVRGLIKGFGAKLAEAQKRAMGQGLGTTIHPSAGVGMGVVGAPSGTQMIQVPNGQAPTPVLAGGSQPGGPAGV